MAFANDRLGVIHNNAPQPATLLVCANRDRFDVAGIQGDAVVVQSPRDDGGKSDQGLVLGEEHMHAINRV